MIRSILLKACAGVLVLTTGCFLPTKESQPKKIEEIRPTPPVFKSISFTIQRKDYIAQLSRVGDNTVRLVPVFQSAIASESYVHRVFDVKPKSVYTLLGINNTDIIVAVDGYLIRKPEQFVKYIELLQSEDSAAIEIIRGGESMLLRYSFIPSLRPKAVKPS